MTDEGKREVVIVGSGIAGTTIAYLLTKHGHRVTMLEVGPEYPYPHTQQYSDEILHQYRDPAYVVAHDVRKLEVSGDYKDARDLPNEQIMVVGGMATRWTAWTPRFMPYNFHTRSQAGYGVDWPLSYDDLEPYYCRAEEHLGVSGSDDDNPFAPPRSKPYPLPPFEMAYEDRVIGDRLRAAGIQTHTAPQARTRNDYGGRPGCKNFNVCGVCPIGARYSPGHHLELARRTGLLTLRANAAVREIIVEAAGRATGVLMHPENRPAPTELGASTVVVAAGAIESARLLLLSARSANGRVLNESGQVGRNLMFNHIRGSVFEYKEPIYAGRSGPRTAQSYQFIDPPDRARHGGVKLDFGTHLGIFMREINGRGGTRWEQGPAVLVQEWMRGSEVVNAIRPSLQHMRTMGAHCETIPSEKKLVDLSESQFDRFGAPVARVHHESAPFDEEGGAFARRIHDEVAQKSGAVKAVAMDGWGSGHHHLGTARMGKSPKESVVDSLGRVHGLSNVYLAGGSIFPGSSALNPTLTIVALAIRTADHLLEQLKSAR